MTMPDMQCRPGLSIVIPAYNEQRRLPHTLNELQRYYTRFNGPFEVIVVDDGSVDETAAVIKRQATALPWLYLLKRPHRGKGAAVRAGMLAARYPQVMLCDADLSMPAEEIDQFLDALDSGYHIAIGSRKLSASRCYDEPVRRRLMSYAFSLLVGMLLVPGITDTQCGFKGFRRDVAHDLFSHGRLDGFSFDVEILFLAHKRGYLLQEVPITWYFSADSRVRAVTDTLDMVADLLRIRYYAARGGYLQLASTSLEDRVFEEPVFAIGTIDAGVVSALDVATAVEHGVGQ